ncbi:sensor histidine kinase [Streptomyces sp. NPDC101152]|uniref:sensor histidine kinase n=1 Tax=Streptomyces sp. NPDC101152 TaxID=3366116 RepID=UPI00380BD417
MTLLSSVGGASAWRLRRLQVRLTVAYTLTMLAGVGALSWLVIRTDARSLQSAEYEELYRRASVSASLVYYDDHDRLQLDGLRDDDATTGPVQVGVIRTEPDGGLSTIYTSFGRRLLVSDAESGRIAHAAMRADTTVRSDGRTLDGHAVYLLALPFYHDGSGKTAGAVVAIGSQEQSHAQHERLKTAVLFGSAALTCLAAVSGHLISGRSLRPAWQSLEAQERLLADTAHELRTPVAIMRGSVDIAGMDPRGLQLHMPRIRRAIDRLTDVVDNVLVRGRLQTAPDTFEPVPLRLDQLVEQICDEAPRNGHRLNLDLHNAVVDADPALVRVAVRNLLDNAFRHGATPGDPDRHADVDVSVRDATVSVADRGPGVQPADLPDLMKRFRSPGGGTGIGLALVQEVAVAHGGSITVAPRSGGGSVFLLRLNSTRRPKWRLRHPTTRSQKSHE